MNLKIRNLLTSLLLIFSATFSKAALAEVNSPLVSGGSKSNPLVGAVGCYNNSAAQLTKTGSLKKLSTSKLALLINKNKIQTASVTVKLNNAKTQAAKKSYTSSLNELKNELLQLTGAKSCASKQAASTLELISTEPNGPIVHYSTAPGNLFSLVLNGKGFGKGMVISVFRADTNSSEFIAKSFLNSTSAKLKLISNINSTVAFKAIQLHKGKFEVSNELTLQLESDNQGGTPTPSPPGDGDSSPSPSPSPSATPSPSPSSTPPPIGSSGDHVATIELDPTTSGVTLLRAVVPVPQGLYGQQDVAQGNSIFGVKDSNGTIVSAQMQPVTRFPDDGTGNGYYDTAEIIAPVSGTQMQYQVFLANSTQPVKPTSGYTPVSVFNGSSVPLPQSIHNLLATGKIVMRAKDVFGYQYERDLLTQPHGLAKITRYGSWSTEVETYGTLTPIVGTPIGAPNGALKHLMGVHAYIGTWANQEAISLSIRISNASSGLDPSSSDDDVYNDLYFDKLELVVDSDVAAAFNIEMPSFGPSYQEGSSTVFPLVRNYEESTGQPKMNFFPRWREMLVRMAISANNPSAISAAHRLIEESNVGFAADGISTTDPSVRLYSYFNPGLASYGATRALLPKMSHLTPTSIRNYLANELSKYWNLINQGKCFLNTNSNSCDYPIQINNYWFWFAWGVKYGGMTSGAELNFFKGSLALAGRSSKGLRLLELQQSGRIARQPRLYAADGHALTYEDMRRTGSCGDYYPVHVFSDFNLTACPSCDPWGFQTATNHQSTYVSNNGLSPSYEAEIKAVYVEDMQHRRRTEEKIESLISLANDSVSRDESAAEAEIVRFEHPDRTQWCSGTTPKYSSGALRTHRPATPGIGTYWGRAHAHGTMVLIENYAIADDAWRSRMRSSTYFDYIVTDILERAQIPCSGIIQAESNKNTNFQYYYQADREISFNEQMMSALMERVYRNVDSNLFSRLQNVYSLSSGSKFIDTFVWNPAWHSSRSAVVISSVTNPTQVYCNWNDMDATAQGYATSLGAAYGEWLMGMAKAYNMTGNAFYLQRSFEKLNNNYIGSTLLQKLQHTDIGDMEEGNTIPLLACAENGICSYP